MCLMVNLSICCLGFFLLETYKLDSDLLMQVTLNSIIIKRIQHNYINNVKKSRKNYATEHLATIKIS